MKKRILYLDILRVIACFSVIVLHVAVSNWNEVSVYTVEWQVFNFYNSLTRFCVPIFVMISGVLFLDINRDINLKKILNNNILILLKVFIYWSLIYDIYNIFIRKVPINLSTFLEIIYGHYHMWFLFMIVGLYIITPFLRKIVVDKKLVEYFLILSFVFGYLVNLLMLIPKINGIIEIIMNNLNLSFIMGFTGYFFTGYYLNRYELNSNIKKIIYNMAIFSLLATIFISKFISIKLGEPYSELYGNLLPNTFIVSCAIFIFIKDNISKKNFSKFILKMINKISLLSLGIYMVHALYIELFLEIGISTLKFNPIISIPIISIIVFICSYITVYIMSKISFLNKYI